MTHALAQTGLQAHLSPAEGGISGKQILLAFHRILRGVDMMRTRQQNRREPLSHQDVRTEQLTLRQHLQGGKGVLLLKKMTSGTTQAAMAQSPTKGCPLIVEEAAVAEMPVAVSKSKAGLQQAAGLTSKILHSPGILTQTGLAPKQMDGMKSLRNKEDNRLDNQKTTLRVAEQ